MTIPVFLKLEKDIFWLFTILNLIGYDDENNPAGMHPLRKKVRDTLKRTIKADGCLKKAKGLLSKRHQSQFIEWLLRKKYIPGELVNIYPKKELTFFNEFNKVFQGFTIHLEEKNIFPWLEVKKFFFQEKENYLPRIIQNLNKLMEFLNVDFRILALNKVFLIPNFLDAYERGYGPKIGQTSFVIYGPFRELNFWTIRHEFLHSIVNHLILDDKLMSKKRIQCSKAINKFRQTNYNSEGIIIVEYLIRSLNIKYEDISLQEKKKLLEQEKKNGFIQIDRIYKKLQDHYQRNEILASLKKIAHGFTL